MRHVYLAAAVGIAILAGCTNALPADYVPECDSYAEPKVSIRTAVGAHDATGRLLVERGWDNVTEFDEYVWEAQCWESLKWRTPA